MKKTHQLKSILILVITLFISIQNLQAQVSTTLYHMYGIPQANQLNPAFQPECKSYVGFPMLSPLSFTMESNPIRYEDVFSYNSQLDQIITFMHPAGDKQVFLNRLEPINSIYSSIGSGPLSVGWRKDQFYFTIDLKERIEMSSTFTKDFMEFLLYGNQNKETFNFSGTGGNVKYFRELALGISYNYEDEFQIGARVKFLFGIADVNTRLSDITLRTNEDRWDLNSQLIVDITAPGLSIPLDSAGFVIWDNIYSDITDVNQLYLDFITNNFRSILGTGNLGFGIDFGFSFKPIENLSISASVNDLALIRWRKNAYQLNQNGSFGWEGVEVTLEEDWDPGEILADSLKKQMNFTAVNEPYTSFLSGKIYAGAAYELLDWLKFGIVDRIRISNYNFYNQLTLSANVMPVSIFSATLSYSIIGDFYANFGLGLSLRLGPFNMYFITDQAPSGYFLPETFNSFNFRFGLNLVFGCPKMSKRMQDRPLID